MLKALREIKQDLKDQWKELELKLIHKVLLSLYVLAVIVVCIKNVIHFINH